jgi:hypothetical protein
MQLDDRNLLKRLLALIPKAIKIGFLVIFLLAAISCVWYRLPSARITNQNGTVINYRVYRSIWGNMYLEDQIGVVTTIYPHFSYPASVTCPNGLAASLSIIRKDSWLVLDPIISLLPVGKTLALDHDPKLKVSKGEVSLNIEAKERITIRF